MDSVFKTAKLTAERFGSRVTGIALKPNIVDFIAPDPVVVVLPQPDEPDFDSEAAGREAFDRMCAENGVSATPNAHGARFIWRSQPSVDAISIGAYGRVHDVTILGRPGVGRNEPRMSTLEAALFESGRPVLMAPPEAPSTIGEHILIHWNASLESARALTASLMFLRAARQVSILEPKTDIELFPPATDLQDYFAEHEVKADIVTVNARGKNQGQIAIDECRRLGCDMILKGAYTQSRLRQMFFGGATNQLIQSSPVPVLFRH
ncbi:MAG: hypothetical protein RLZ98_3174 [Pseudomonadota bacterium]|jgi:hypothetical protein